MLMDANNSVIATEHPATCTVDEDSFVKAMQIIVTVASSLSILGAFLIILMSYCRVYEDSSPQLVEIGTFTEREIEKSSYRHNERSDSNSTITSDGQNAVGSRRVNVKKLATVPHPARLILACISAADIVVAVSHIWGVSNKYDTLRQLHPDNTPMAGHRNHTASTECGAQAFPAIFGTISSFLWSDVLALVALVMQKSSKTFKPRYFVSYRAFTVYNIICWGIPLLVVSFLGGIKAVGFEEAIDIGWCYTHANYRQKSRILGYMFLSYDFWVSGSIIWIIVIVAYILCVNIYVCATGGRHKSTLSRRNGSTHVEADLDSEQHEPLIADNRQEQENEQAGRGCCKVCCAQGSCSKPVMMLTMAALLVVFRIWATVLDFWSMAKSKRSLHCTHPYPVLLALAGFGNSSQGLINFIVFILFNGECSKLIFSRCREKGRSQD